MNSKLIKRNILFSVINQITTIICGLIIPRIILGTFGSATNGLVSSINQFLNYVSLLEGGVSGVAAAALYKPLLEKDKEGINKVVNAIQQYFRKLGLICTCFTIAVAFAYPYFKQTHLDYWSVFILTIILGTRLIFQYTLSVSYRLLISADQKVYFNSIVHIIISIVHLLLIFISVNVSNDVVSVYMIGGLAYLIQPLFYIMYVKKHYAITKYHGNIKDALKQKWDGFGQNLAYFIHSNTDVVLLTIFSTLSNISIYSVYLMVANALKGLISTVSSSIVPSIGNTLAKGDCEKSNYYFGRYEYAMEIITFLFYTCGIELVIPFISVYTKSITDANYIQPLFGTLILLAEMVYCIRAPYISVAYASGHFRQTSKFAYLEAGMNIAISIILVQIWGLPGVAIGTLVSMSIRAIQQVQYLKKNILMRDTRVFYRKTTIFGITSFFSILVSRIFIPQHLEDFGSWLFYAVVAFIMTVIFFFIVNRLFYKDELKTLIKNLIGAHLKKVNM